MSFDYWAAHTFVDKYEGDQRQAVDYLLRGNGRLPANLSALADINDTGAQLELLVQTTVIGLKEYARTGPPRKMGGLLNQLPRINNYLIKSKELLDKLGLSPSLPGLTMLPIGSFAIHFSFALISPYISKDDAPFHLLDNPVKKDKQFRLPYVAPSQWKGALKHALWQSGYKENDEGEVEKQVKRLFGMATDNKPVNDAAKDNKRGRLYFYPTFFTETSLEVINPHDRSTGAGSNPILIESVPAKATGTFTLLYTPLDRIGKDEAETRQQTLTDLQLVAEGLQAMYTVYGFGAKTSSGFGLAGNKLPVSGHLKINYPSADNPIEQDFNNLLLLKRKADALKRFVFKKETA